MRSQKRKSVSQAEWDLMCLKNRTRLREHCQVQQGHDTGPVNAADAERRLHRLMARTVTREEGSLSGGDVQRRVSALKARTWLGNLGLPVTSR